MNTENINLALSQLESSLKDLDSARKQVEKVIESSGNLTVATSRLMSEVKHFTENVNGKTSNVISEFSEKLSEFDKKINFASDVHDRNINEGVKQIKGLTLKLQETTDNAINEFKVISVKTIKEQEVEISKTIQSISNYCTKLQNLIDKLSVFDYTNQLNSLDANISRLYPINQDIEKQSASIVAQVSNVGDKIGHVVDQVNNVVKQVNNVERNLRAELVASNEKQRRLLSNFQEKLNQNLDKQVAEFQEYMDRKQTNSYITWALIIIGVIIILINK